MSKKNDLELFLRAGINLMARKGYTDMGIQEILIMTGLPRSSFYHHFPSKENFAVETLEYFEKLHCDGCLCLLKDIKYSPLTRIQNYFERCISNTGSDINAILLVSLRPSPAFESPVFTASLARAQSNWRLALVRCLEEARQKGELLETTDVDTMAEFFLCSWQGAMMTMAMVRNPKILEQTFNVLLAAVSKG